MSGPSNKPINVANVPVSSRQLPVSKTQPVIQKILAHLDDNATNEDIKAVASAWLKAAKFGSPSVTC
ncbi:MAG: hypothetical protein QNK32_07360 [Porticoccus sp.]|nr:hypothetical protein [Porticoccus sp.]